MAEKVKLRGIAFMMLVCAMASTIPEAAQTCRDTNIDPKKISAELLAHPTVSGIRRGAAIVGAPMIPALRQLAGSGDLKIGNYSETAAAARTALARLGDPPILRQLEERLSQKGNRDVTVAILRGANTPETFSILMNFVLTDKCRTCEFSDDYMYDARVDADRALASMIPDPPDTSRAGSTVPVWGEWWAKHKDHPLPPPPHEALADPYLRCLAQLGEFREADAILELADAGGQQVVPVLKQFALFGTKGLPGDWDTQRGNAQAALAKLGDRAELETILRQLKSGMYTHALGKLQFIGSREAVDAITAELGKPPNQWESKWHRDASLGVLVEMVKQPPLPKKDEYTDRDIETWKSWWARNRETAELVAYKP